MSGPAETSSTLHRNSGRKHTFGFLSALPSTFARRARQTMPVTTGAYYPWLDPLRFFAALSVVAFHLGDLAGLVLPASLPGAWFRAGFLGVDLFFAISGAVIFLSIVRLAQKSETHGQSGGWRRVFVQRRLVRLVPLYLVTSILFIALVNPAILTRDGLGSLLTTQLLFISNLFVSTHGVINGPTWSLGVEMQFYLLMALVGPWLLKRGVWLPLIFAAVLAIAWRFGVSHWVSRLPEAVQGHRMFIYTLQLPGVLDGFAAGIAAMWWRLHTSETKAARRFIWLALATVVAWWGVMDLLLRHGALYWSHPAMVLGMRGAVALASGLVVATALSVPARFSPGALGRWMGNTSYGIYLWHLGVILLVVRRWPDADPLWQAGIVLGITLVLASLGWYALERPMLRWLRPRSRAKPSA